MGSNSQYSDAELENIAKSSVNLYVKLLKIGGLWCIRKSKFIDTLKSLYRNFILLWSFVHGFSVFMALYESRNNFDELVEIMSICISMIMFYLKIFPFIFRRKEIEHIIQDASENFFIHRNRLTLENKTIIMSIIKQGKTFTTIYISCNFSLNVIYALISPLLASVPETVNGTDAVRELNVKIWTPVDASVSPNYEIFSIYIAVTCLVIGFNFFVTDLFIMVLMIYCTGQFELLCDSLSNASKNVKKKLLQDQRKSSLQPKFDELLKCVEVKGEQQAEKEENMTSTFSPKFMHLETEKYLMECIKHHQSLIDFAARVEDLWKTYFFAQFLTASFLICFLGYKSMSVDMDISLLKNMGYLGSVIFQLALQCLFGSNLMTESNAVYNAIYSSDWYNQSNNYKFYSMMMIMRAQKPVQIRAGIFGVMSLPLFASMMRSSYSYLALLKQMQEE